ncbi:hypothetical protein OPQ81_010534 [Rhizoctonia solani]|nr:hypothetical protein OPQ81_010534 [Rhizoctonia solani]
MVETDKDWPSRDELSSLAITPSPSQLYFDCQILHTIPGDWRPTPVCYGVSNETVEAIAAGLHALWPAGVIRGNYPPPKNPRKLNFVEAVNASLRRMHEVNGQGNWAEVVRSKQLCTCAPPCFEAV